MKNFLIVVQEEYVDGCAALSHPDGEFGATAYVEFDDAKELVIGTYTAPDEVTAIANAAKKWDFSTEVLSAYELAA